MLDYINPEAGASSAVTLFSKPGCPYCSRTKAVLGDNIIAFEEIGLDRNVTMHAVAGADTVPQAFRQRLAYRLLRGHRRLPGQGRHALNAAFKHGPITPGTIPGLSWPLFLRTSVLIRVVALDLEIGYSRIGLAAVGHLGHRPTALALEVLDGDARIVG